MNFPVKTVSTAEIREIDRRAIHDLGIPSLLLMENAAQAVADAAAVYASADPEARVMVVCGTGNNGGDGFACARLLLDRGIAAEVLLVGSPEKLTPDASANFTRLIEMGGAVVPYEGQTIPPCSCIVDALFGFGLNRAVTGLYAQAIAAINASPAPCIACDLPSGLNGDTGLPMGIAVKAAKTVTFTFAKTGLLQPEAGAYVGQLDVADIGIPVNAGKTG